MSEKRHKTPTWFLWLALLLNLGWGIWILMIRIDCADMRIPGAMLTLVVAGFVGHSIMDRLEEKESQ